MKFGNILKSLMIEGGITQQKLANEIGYAQRTVSSWINNQSEPTETAIKKCAAFFKVSSDYLLDLDDFGAPTAAPAVNSASKETTTEQERELLRYFRELSPFLKDVALDTVRGWSTNSGNGNVHKKA